MSEIESNVPDLSKQEIAAALAWMVDMGVDEAVEPVPVDRLKAKKPQATEAAPRSAPSMMGREMAAKGEFETSPQIAPQSAPQSSNPGGVGKRGTQKEAEAAALACQSLDELRTAVETFEGGSLKQGAKSCVFADGVARPTVLVVGEAPGADEDRAGTPFVGVSGQLLDKILNSIGLSRAENIRITNVIPWRPLGNRTPDKETVALYLPFLHRHIALCQPRFILTVGKVPTAALTGLDEAMSRSRGTIHSFSLKDLYAGSDSRSDSGPDSSPDSGPDSAANLPAMPAQDFPMIATYHPAYLLRSPEAKSHVWRDMLSLKKILKENDIII